MSPTIPSSSGVSDASKLTPNDELTPDDELISKFSPPLDPALILAIASDYRSPARDDLHSSPTLERILSGLVSDLTALHSVPPTGPLESSSSSSNFFQSLSPLHGPETLLHRSSITSHTSPKDTPAPHGPSTSPEQASALQTLAPPSCLEQIVEILPQFSAMSINTAVQKSSDPSNSNEVIEILLGDGDVPRPNGLPAGVSSGKPASRRARKGKGPSNKRRTETVHLNDVLHRDQRLWHQKAQVYSVDHRQPPISPWVSLDSRAHYVSELLQIPSCRLSSAFHERGNWVLAMEDVLHELEHDQKGVGKSEEDLDRFKTQLDFLRQLSPTAEDEQKLRRLLWVARLDAGVAFELLCFLNELVEQYGSIHFNYFHQYGRDVPSHSAAVNHDAFPEPQSIHCTSETQEQAHVWSADSGQASIKPQQGPWQEQAPRARLKAEQVAFSSNPRHHFTNSKLIAAVSSVYRTDLARLKQEIHEWELCAARQQVLERQRMRGDPHWLDLHGLTKQQAIQVTEETLESWWSTSFAEYPSQVEPLRIVTGVGTHSKNRKPILFPNITAYLNRHSWRWRSVGDDENGSTVGSLIVLGRHK